MKKKLFLITLIVALFVCVFAISVSADDIIANTITSDTYGTVYQLSADPGLDNADQYKSTLKNIYDTGTDTESLAILFDGTYYYVFPSSYIVVEDNLKGKLELYVDGALNNSSMPGINTAITEWNTADGTALPTFTGNTSYKSKNINELVRLEIPTDVTYIDRDHCRLQCPNIVEVRFHPNVRLGSARYMFSGCTKLTTVIGLDTLTNPQMTDSCYFSGCTSLVTIKLPASITTIGSQWFSECTSFTGIENWDDIKNNITSINDKAFYKCTSLTNFETTLALTSIGQETFRDCTNLTGTFYFSNLKTIKAHAFNSCTSLIIGDINLSSATSLGGGIFWGNPSLTSVIIPEGITSIEGSTFRECRNLKSVKIPSTVTKFAGNVFEGCTSLTTVEFAYDYTKYPEFGSAFTTVSNGQVFKGCTSLTTLIFPNSLTHVDNGAFSGCSNLKTLVLGASFATTSQCPAIPTSVESLVLSSTYAMNGDLFSEGSDKFSFPPSFVIYYTGTKAQAETLQTVNTNNCEIAKATLVSYQEFTSDSFERDESVHYMVYDYSACRAFYNDVHLNPQTTYGFENENAKYFTNYCSYTTCERCIDIDVEKLCDALFTSRGYSKYEGSIVFGIYANTDAIKAYETLTEKTIKYGLVTAVSVNDGLLIDTNGEVINSANTLSIDCSGTSYSIMQVKMTGITSDYHQTALNCCAYVVDGGNVTYLYDCKKEDATVATPASSSTAPSTTYDTLPAK